MGESYEIEGIFPGEKGEETLSSQKEKHEQNDTETKMNDLCEEQQLANFCKIMSCILKVYSRKVL